MISLRNIDFSYGDDVALHNVSFNIGDNELLGIIGPSGSGKTTLLRILLGELLPTHGTVSDPSHQLTSVGYVPQLDAGERSFPLTVGEMVLLGGAARSARKPWFDRAEKAHAAKILERLGILHLRQRRLSELSGGQFQRALIARALMARPTMLLLDEPTSGIDLATRRQVLELLFDLRDEGYTVVLTTHDLNWVASHLPRIVCINTTITADGAPIDVLTESVVSATYGAHMKVLVHENRPIVIDSDTTTIGGRQ